MVSPQHLRQLLVATAGGVLVPDRDPCVAICPRPLQWRRVRPLLGLVDVIYLCVVVKAKEVLCVYLFLQ